MEWKLICLFLSLCVFGSTICVFLFVSSFIIPVCCLSLIFYLNFHNHLVFISLSYQSYVSSIFINSSLTCFSFCLRFYYPTVIAFSSFLHLSIDFVTRFTKLILCCLSRPRFWAFHFLHLIIFSFKTFFNQESKK